MSELQTGVLQELYQLFLDPESRQNLALLVAEFLRVDGVIPFVGAGLSMPLGFPGWSEFLRSQATLRGQEEEIEALIQAGRFEEAAGRLSRKLGMTAFEDALADSFGEDRLPEVLSGATARSLLLLPRITAGPVITTNFDRAIERAFEQQGRRFSERVWGSAIGDVVNGVANTLRPALIKIHGDVVGREDRVLTISEYEKHYGKNKIDFKKKIPAALLRLFQTKPVLFLGCSLKADRTLHVVQHAARNSNRFHYALVEEPADGTELAARKQFLSDQGIRAIWYPVSRHELVSDALDSLARLRTASSNGRLGDQGSEGAGDPVSNSDAMFSGVTQAMSANHLEPPCGTAAHDGATDAPDADVWGKRAWSWHVHRDFKEDLLYVLIRIRPYQRERAKLDLMRFREVKGLGEFRVYELFGPYDLLLRAWVPSQMTTEILAELKPSITNCSAVFPFDGDEVLYRWHDNPSESAISARLKRELTRRSVQAVQDGEHPDLLQRLERCGLVVDRTAEHSEDRINFFVSVNFIQPIDAVAQAFIKEKVRTHLQNHPRLQNVSIDYGHGFAQIMIKAECQDYYVIADVPNWLSETFEDKGVVPETYLVKSRVEVFADDRIGAATFAAYEGRDRFLQALLPSFYPDDGSSNRVDVKKWVKQHEAALASLDESGKAMIGAFLTSVIDGELLLAGIELMRWFVVRENFLRQTHGEFAGRRGKIVREMYGAAKIDQRRLDGKGTLTLVDILQVLSHTVRGSDDERAVGSDWTGVSIARNAGGHGKEEDLQDWQGLLGKLVNEWPRLTYLVNLVEKETKRTFREIHAPKLSSSS
ncbi:MAG: SIR2 family protein [Bryobacterales bacterium]|nr:SIR2 family protein [Bryobacterales bacterium]